MVETLGKMLAKVQPSAVLVESDDTPDAHGTASIVLNIGVEITIRASYWRLIENSRRALSSFDHEQQYGHPAPIDAKARLALAIDGTICQELKMDQESGDLILHIGPSMRLQVLNLTGYEDYQISFRDGTREYSNQVLT